MSKQRVRDSIWCWSCSLLNGLYLSKPWLDSPAARVENWLADQCFRGEMVTWHICTMTAGLCTSSSSEAHGSPVSHKWHDVIIIAYIMKSCEENEICFLFHLPDNGPCLGSRKPKQPYEWLSYREVRLSSGSSPHDNIMTSNWLIVELSGAESTARSSKIQPPCDACSLI